MDDLAKLLPTLPIWLSVPIVIIGALITLVPKVLELLGSLNRKARSQQLEKGRLKNLKLRYEIEVLKKSHHLEPFADDIQSPLMAAATLKASARDDEFQPRSILGLRQRVLFAVFGVLTFMLLAVLWDASHQPTFISFFVLLAMAVRAFILALLAVVVVWLNPTIAASRVQAFLIGLSIPALFSSLLTLLSQYN